MALGKYEVVVLIDAANPQEKINSIKKSVEELIEKFGGKVLDKDDIGYLETLYEIGSSNNPYFYSLYTDLEGTTIKDFKRQLGILPGVVRYKVFKMKPNQKFLKLKDIEKEIEKIDFTGLTKSGIFNEINQGTSSNEEKK
jgi:ribosomal protein S6